MAFGCGFRFTRRLLGSETKHRPESGAGSSQPFPAALHGAARGADAVMVADVHGLAAVGVPGVLESLFHIGWGQGFRGG